MLRYNGTGPNFLREIRANFPDDPDWANPTVLPRPDDACWVMDYGSYIPRRALLSFAFFNVGGLELSGGTANIYEFHMFSPKAFGNDSGHAVVRKGESVAGALLSKDWVMTNVGPIPHGIRLDTIAAPAGAVVLKISVMEVPRL